MKWRAATQVGFIFGLAKNTVSERLLGAELHEAKLTCGQTGKPTRVFRDFTHRTQKSGSRERRVVGKAEYLPGDTANPRFVVTSLTPEAVGAATVYEREYCGRGEMGNRIKEQQLDLFADHPPGETRRANQRRLYFSTVAFVVMRALREHGLGGTPMADARCDTLRSRLFTIAARVTVSVRRVVASMSEFSVVAGVFSQALANLSALATPREAIPGTG